MAHLRAQFTDAEVVELGLVIASFVMLGRLHRSFGVAPMTGKSHAVLAGGRAAPPPDRPPAG